MRSKLSAITARTPSRRVPFAAQSRDEPGAVLGAGDHHQRHAFVPVALAAASWIGISLSVRVVPRAASFDLRRHLVAHPDVGEGAADHHVVVQAPRGVIDEIARRDAERSQDTRPAGVPFEIAPIGEM